MGMRAAGHGVIIEGAFTTTADGILRVRDMQGRLYVERPAPGLSMSRENCCARNADIARSTPRSGIPDLITKKAEPSPAASPAYGGAAPAVKPRGDGDLEHVPPQLNQGDSRGAEDGRGYRH